MVRMGSRRTRRIAALAAAVIGAQLSVPSSGAVPPPAEVNATVNQFTAASVGWGFVDDNGNGGTSGFQPGPATPPAGVGSATLGVSAANQGYTLVWGQVPKVRLADITSLGYSTYRQSVDAGNNLAISLQLNVDYNGTDADTTFQGRLVFEPYQGNGGNVPAGTWQTWTPLTSGKWWASRAPGNALCPQATPCTWSQVLSYFPNAEIHSTAGALVLKAGSGWAPFTGNVDKVVFGTATQQTTTDFESWTCPISVSGSVWTQQDDCTVTSTLWIPDGVTFDGNGKTIYVDDPAGGAFTGAVIQNAAGATSMALRNVRIVGGGDLATVCHEGDARLAGVRFRDAGGSVKDSSISGVAQMENGVLAGCQEGVALEARNDSTTTWRTVELTGNSVSGYQKAGMVVNGLVAATISNNTVQGAGPVGVPSPAQNGIQISRKATAQVRGNTVRDNNYAPSDWLACGVLLYQAGGVKLQSNTYSGNERDLCNVGRGGGRFQPGL
jgi:hypothetical protein